MENLTREQFAELLAEHRPPCVSIYMPISHVFTTGDENHRVYKTLTGQAERALASQYPDFKPDGLIQRLRSLDSGRDFWNRQWEGLAVFCSQDYLRWVRLPRQVPQNLVVADTFHTKPLIRLLQSSGRFNLLCLAQQSVQLYEGDRFALKEVPLRGIPLSDLLVKSELGHKGTHRRNVNPDGSAAGAAGAYQARLGQEGTDIEPFARIVDAAVWDQYSRRNGLPLILCAEPEYHPIFRRISRNQNLLPDGIKLNPKQLSQQRLREEAWKILEPHFRERIDRIIDVYHAARAHRLASGDLPDVSRAVATGKVGTLLVDEDKQIPAKFDESTGMIYPVTPGSTDDLLDELAQTVLKRDGQVLVLPHDQMPTDSGVAAIYRY